VKTAAKKIRVLVLMNLRRTGMGKISVISTSKIKKITAIKKNRREKGTRADLLGSNPHSKADGFSRSNVFLLAMSEFTIIKISGRIIDNNIMLKIIFTV
jgi:hypothetical protein